MNQPVDRIFIASRAWPQTHVARRHSLVVAFECDWDWRQVRADQLLEVVGGHTAPLPGRNAHHAFAVEVEGKDPEFGDLNPSPDAEYSGSWRRPGLTFRTAILHVHYLRDDKAAELIEKAKAEEEAGGPGKAEQCRAFVHKAGPPTPAEREAAATRLRSFLVNKLDACQLRGRLLADLATLAGA